MMNFKLKFLIGIILFLLSTSLFSCKKQADSESKNLSQGQIVKIDDKASEELLLNIIQNEKFLSEAASIASERASNEELKAFALQVQEDHKIRYQDFKSIYESNGKVFPEKLPENLRQKLYKLTVSNDSNFDKYFHKNYYDDTKSKFDSVSRMINEKEFVNLQDILMKVSSGFNTDIDNLEKINL